MTKYARLTDAVANGDRTVIEVVESDPGKLFHPEIAKQFMSVPNATVPGSVKNGSTWTHPEPAEPEPPRAPARRLLLSPVEFKMLFASAERIAIRQRREGETPDLVIDDWFGILDDPRLTTVDLTRQDTKDGLAYLVAVGVLTAERKAEIEAGVPA